MRRISGARERPRVVREQRPGGQRIGNLIAVPQSNYRIAYSRAYDLLAVLVVLDRYRRFLFLRRFYQRILYAQLGKQFATAIACRCKQNIIF